MLCDDSSWNPAQGATLCSPNSLTLKSILGCRIRCRCTCQAGRAGFRGDQICIGSRRKWRTSAHRHRHVPAEWWVQASGDWYAFSEISTKYWSILPALTDKMNAEQLVEVVLTNPTIYLQKADKDTELLATSYSFQPLVNRRYFPVGDIASWFCVVVFCRDQQITTRNGLVIANLSSPIRYNLICDSLPPTFKPVLIRFRERETKVMKFCFTKLGVPIIGQVPTPGKLEGGDFFPLGKDLCMVGVGSVYF